MGTRLFRNQEERAVMDRPYGEQSSFETETSIAPAEENPHGPRFSMRSVTMIISPPAAPNLLPNERGPIEDYVNGVRSGSCLDDQKALTVRRNVIVISRVVADPF